MSRYIRYKYQKQQINFLNCNDINKWIDTCQTRVIGFDSVCESNCNCGEIREMEYQPQYRTKKLNPNYSYECVDMDRHYKLQKQISYDNGITWMDIDEYQIGELYESNSPFCSAEVIIYDWFPTGRYKCVGYNKINEEVKRVSFDNGLNWSDLSFVDDNGNVTYEYRFNASNIEENCCDCGYREYEWRISNPIEYVCDVNTKSEVWYKWQYCPTDPSLDVKLDEVELRNPVEDEDYCGVNVYFVWDASSKNYCQFKLNNTSYSATTENSVLNEDGTYTYSASLSDLGITEVTIRNQMFYIIDNLLKVYKVPKSNDTSLKNMLLSCRSLNYIDVNAFGDTSQVTDMGNMFNSCRSLTSLDLSNLNTSNVIDMNSMFRGCSGLTSLDLSSFNTSNVTDMTYMFTNCSGLTSLDLTSFNTSNVTNMYNMFQNCSGLTSLDLSNFNTSNVTKMNNMFYNCTSLSSLDLSNFNTSAVTSMSYMFNGCTSLTSLDLSNWDTSAVTSMYRMFYNCNSLSEIIMDNCSCDTVSFIIDRLNDVSLSNVLIYSNSGCEGTNCRPTTDREYNGYRIEVIKPSCEFYEVSNFNVYKVYTDTNTDINCNVSTSNGEELYLENQIPNRTNPSGNNDGDEPRTVTAYTDYGEYTFEQGVDPYTQYNLIYEWYSSQSSRSEYILNGTSARTSDNPVYVDYNNTLTSTASAFTRSNITNLIKFDIDTSNVTDMSYMFKNCNGLTSLDLSSFDTSKVTTMSWMFQNCSGLTSLDLSSFNTSAVTTMNHMFYNCSGLTSLDLSNWNTSTVIGMNSMFSHCYSLTSLDLSSFNTSAVTNMSYMFNNCSGLTSLDLSNWNTSNVTNMSYMFEYCSGLTSLDLSNWDISKVTNMEGIFDNCDNLKYLDLSGWDLTNSSYYIGYLIPNSLETLVINDCNCNTVQKISKYVYDNLENCEVITNNICFVEGNLTFEVSSLYGGVEINDTYYSAKTNPYTFDFDGRFLNVSNIKFNGSLIRITEIPTNIINPIKLQFYSCDDLTSLDLNIWGNIKLSTMYEMFSDCRSLTSVYFGTIDTSNVTSMSYMFYDCRSLTSLDLNSFNTSAVTNMSYMFYNCFKLTSVYFGTIDTSAVTDMSNMFNNCSGLTSLDLSNWNTSNVTNMSYMFDSCRSLTSLDLSNLNTSNVTNMAHMFRDCNSLTSLDVSNWNTSAVTDMRYMFTSCSGLTSLDLSSFNISNVTNMSYMFRYCSNLKSLDLSNWDTSKAYNMEYMFYNCNSLRTITMKNCNETIINKIKGALGNAGISSNITIITD